MIILKFPLEIKHTQVIDVPKGAKILTVQTQSYELMLWALCDENEPGYEKRSIAIYVTGRTAPGDPGEYISTFQTGDGAFVGHVFEVPYSQESPTPWREQHARKTV